MFVKKNCGKNRFWSKKDILKKTVLMNKNGWSKKIIGRKNIGQNEFVKKKILSKIILVNKNFC